jgi:hypothetical protein
LLLELAMSARAAVEQEPPADDHQDVDGDGGEHARGRGRRAMRSRMAGFISPPPVRARRRRGLGRRPAAARAGLAEHDLRGEREVLSLMSSASTCVICFR